MCLFKIILRCFCVSTAVNYKLSATSCVKLCYAIIYGMGDRSLADQLGVTLVEATLKREHFMRAFPAVAEFLTSTVQGIGLGA